MDGTGLLDRDHSEIFTKKGDGEEEERKRGRTRRGSGGLGWGRIDGGQRGVVGLYFSS